MNTKHNLPLFQDWLRSFEEDCEITNASREWLYQSIGEEECGGATTTANVEIIDKPLVKKIIKRKNKKEVINAPEDNKSNL